MERKKSKKSIILFVLILVIIAATIVLIIYRSGTRRAIKDIPDPVQKDTVGDTVLKIDDYNVLITYLCDYEIEALVVNTKDYIGFGIQDKLSNRDFGLAWGGVAEYNEMIDFHWSQNGRFLYMKVDNQRDIDNVGGFSYINTHSSNNHIIPANDETKLNMWLVRRGDHIRIKGYLVNVDAVKPNGSESYYWHSSTSRTDTGDGACEVIYATEISWV